MPCSTAVPSLSAIGLPAADRFHMGTHREAPEAQDNRSASSSGGSKISWLPLSPLLQREGAQGPADLLHTSLFLQEEALPYWLALLTKA